MTFAAMKLLTVLVAALATSGVVFVRSFGFGVPTRRHLTSSSTSLQMGIFDAIGKAFSNEEYQSPPEGIKATARHILVKDPGQVDIVMDKLRGGEAFANVAREFSTCPSGAQGGSLGSFRPGTMVKEFDDVIFDNETNLGEVVGPVQTQFGYHLIVVDKRTGV